MILVKLREIFFSFIPNKIDNKKLIYIYIYIYIYNKISLKQIKLILFEILIKQKYS